MLEEERKKEKKNIPDEVRLKTHKKIIAKAASKYNNNKNKEKFKH